MTTKHGIQLDLAINTAQVARTFQDRSHNFILMPRTSNGVEIIPDDLNIENMGLVDHVFCHLRAIRILYSMLRY